MKFDYEDRLFQAKIRGYEIKEEVKVKPMTKKDWGLVMKTIKKEQLKFERNKDIIKINRLRYGG